MLEHLSDDYVEHQYTAGFTRLGLLDYVHRRIEQSPNHRIVIHKVISECDFVFLLVEEKLNGVDVARGELFRVSRGKIAEHWGSQVVDEKNRKNANRDVRRSPAEPQCRLREAIRRPFRSVGSAGFRPAGTRMFLRKPHSGEYRQHSPKGGDGLEGLVTILRKMKENGQKMIMQPKRVIVDGDFIVCHRLYDSFPKHPLVNRINTFDLFRLNVEGRAVEHWGCHGRCPDRRYARQNVLAAVARAAQCSTEPESVPRTSRPARQRSWAASPPREMVIPLTMVAT